MTKNSTVFMFVVMLLFVSYFKLAACRNVVEMKCQKLKARIAVSVFWLSTNNL